MSVCPSGPVLPCLFISSLACLQEGKLFNHKTLQNVFKVATVRSEHLNYFCQ